MLTDAHFLTIAHVVAEAGTCSRLQVGALLVRNRRVVSMGYNGSPAGTPHCVHDFDNQGACAQAVHAEVNTIAFAALNGVPTWDTVLYTTHSPCRGCAKLLINAGIKEVKYGVEYRDRGGLDELAAVGIITEELGEPDLRLVSVALGDRQGLHSRQPTDPAFDQGWAERAAARRGRSPGL